MTLFFCLTDPETLKDCDFFLVLEFYVFNFQLPIQSVPITTKVAS